MALLYTADQLPTSSADLISEFDERYLAGISAAPPPTWVEQFGDVIDVGSPLVRFPVNLLTTKYLAFSGESRFKSLDDKYFDLKVAEYDAGYEAKLLDLTTIKWAYRNWQDAPGRFIAAQQRFIAKLVADLLEDGTTATSPWDGVAFFSAAHFADGTSAAGGTFSNYQNSASDITDVDVLAEEMTAMMGVTDSNGDKIGVQADTLIVPTSRAMAMTNLLKQDIIANAAGTATMRNPFFGVLNVVHVPELTDDDAAYLVDTKLLRAAGVPLFAVAKFRAPESLGLRKWDEGSDFFKNTGKLKVSSHLWAGAGLVFPHAIRRITLSA